MQYNINPQQKERQIERRKSKAKRKENSSSDKNSIKVKRLQPKKKTMENIETTGDLRSGRVRSRENSKSREGSAVSIRDRERSPSVELMSSSEQMTDSPIGYGISTRHFEGTGQPTLLKQISTRNKDSIMMMLNCIHSKVKSFENNISQRDKTPSIVEREFLDIDDLCEDFLSNIDNFKHTEPAWFSKFYNKISPIRNELIRITIRDTV